MSKITTSLGPDGKLTHRAIVKTNTFEADELSQLLDHSSLVSDSKSGAILWGVMVWFGGNISASINLVNAENGPYVDSVLFENDCEVQTLEAGDNVFGDHVFELDGVVYCVSVT